MDNMEKYHKDKEFRKRFINYVKKYQATEKGKASVERARQKIKETNYIADYCKRRRDKARAEGMCIKCYKRKAALGYVTCEGCLGHEL